MLNFQSKGRKRHADETELVKEKRVPEVEPQTMDLSKKRRKPMHKRRNLKQLLCVAQKQLNWMMEVLLFLAFRAVLNMEMGK
ncbi:hypothetical protein M8C21_018589 [Ambrosia artemisiifolia]|uniref:Uncharacterized protein n=1 Tax=Ambrosia artemisiifolia TaxID=4212 RepID=A0AAD5CN81_AMBAR|nr:hypothetical protein M8C21_018589 [Ambrosia artemisiifolia]